jgi:hypothetical protein
VLVPLYLEGEEAGPCRILLKIPLVEPSLRYPYDSLIDRTWTTVAHSRFRQNKSTIPVSHVYYFYLEGVDILGGNCPWILQERLPGTPLHREIGGLSASKIQRIGQQWGIQLALNHSLRFPSAGALRTTASGARVTIQTVGADPDGNHLTADHYSSPFRTVNGVKSDPRDRPTTAVEYFLSLANTAFIRLMSEFTSYLKNSSPEVREEMLWGSIAYIYLRHLHLFIPRYASSDLLEDYYVLDLPNLDLGNIHIDAAGFICGIVSCDGMNIIPSQLTLRLPQLSKEFRSHAGDQPQARNRSRQRYTFLLESVSRAFWTGLLKYAALRDGKTLKGMDLNAVWATGSKIKSFERLLYRFTGNNDDESHEFRAYLVYARETWDSLFRPSSTGYSDTRQLAQFIKRNWIALKAYYPQLCLDPPVPIAFSPCISRQARSPAPLASHFSSCHSTITPTPSPGPSRLRRTRSEGAKSRSRPPNVNKPNKLGSKLADFTDMCVYQFSTLSKIIRRGGRKSL